MKILYFSNEYLYIKYEKIISVFICHGSCDYLVLDDFINSVLQRDEGVTLTVANADRNYTLRKVDVNLQISYTGTFTSKQPWKCLQNPCTCW